MSGALRVTVACTFVRVGDHSLLRWVGHRVAIQFHHWQRSLVHRGGDRRVEPDMADAVAAEANETAATRGLGGIFRRNGPYRGQVAYVVFVGRRAASQLSQAGLLLPCFGREGTRRLQAQCV